MYESTRKSNPATMSDVYDSPRWRRIAGEPTDKLIRVLYQICVDAFPWSSRKYLGSVTPVQLFLASLPPWMRYKVQYMLVLMLLPPKVKGQAAKKYFGFAADYEMNDLHHVGVDGVRFLLYGSTLDTPGRRELLCMQAVTAFYPCPFCTHTWQPGLRSQVYGGFRRFLPLHHPWRAKTFSFKGHLYEFRDHERRPPPIERTDALVKSMLARAKPGRPCCGHKSAPFLSKWAGADWGRSFCEMMHDLKCVTDMIVKGLVGKGSDGMYKSWGNKDSHHRASSRAFGIFKEFADGAEPPWRLSKDDVKIMDARVNRIWWPHYTDKMTRDNVSFWKKSDRMWKCKHRWFVLLCLLPTCLHGFVKAVHLGIVVFVDAIRRLLGQVRSANESRSLEEETGTTSILRSIIQAVHLQLVMGLVLVEGSFPCDHLNPILHDLCHFAPQTKIVGILLWCAMWSFERNNKRMKNLVRNNLHPEASLSNSIQLDIATRYVSYEEDLGDEGPVPTIAYIPRGSSGKLYKLSRKELTALRLLGARKFGVNVRSFDTARILGVHFKAREWGKQRCGSVFVTTYCGKSRYGVIERFIRVGGGDYVCVNWLHAPVYPYAPMTLVVRTRGLMCESDQSVHRCVIRADDIEPTSVAVLPHEDGVHYYLMREKGTDRRCFS